jgi:RHS repeat-associated protein
MITASGTKYYYHFDGLGSVIALSNTSGGIVERYSYDVFGEPNRVSSVGNPYMFTGRQRDENGLYYYRARYYKPSIGRFLQPDPVMQFMQIALVKQLSGDNIPGRYLSPTGMKKFLGADPIGKFLNIHPAGRFLQKYQYGFPVGLNLYTYCNNNPLNWIDSYGLCKNVGKGLMYVGAFEIAAGLVTICVSAHLAEIVPLAIVGATVGSVVTIVGVGTTLFGFSLYIYGTLSAM